MVRVWGGGYYPDEIFFNTCDEKGIMVWEDLMFACAMYPGDKEFLASVETELNHQMPRISAHPSVVLINGNNEVDVAWKNWGFQSQYKLNEADQKVILKAYDDLFKDLAVKVINKWTNTNYIHTSPLSNWGNDDFYNHGSQHYWGVWHGKDPMSDFAKKIGRFNAEYGFQSFPEFSTMNQFSEKSDWSLQSKVMKHHQKSYVGNGMIEKHANLLFGKTKDFEQFVYYSQLTQAYAVSSAVAGHRLDAPRCMGTLYWQLN
ncbi:MAG: glycoside hydrolase family 2 protein, partial [Crocinitomicaceae bacterium]|nr:glycoside hydrolase family 2 protein [Crocinitomicaceae bacterium]